jgi:AGZA family xanthine/uracil permease-like MFS transporter
MVFAALALSGAADKLQDLLPGSLKCAITVAIGVFQAFVGLQVMGVIVRSDATLVTFGDASQPQLWLSLGSTLLVAALIVRKVKGALLIGIVFTAVAYHALGLTSNTLTEQPQTRILPVDSATPRGLDFGAGLNDVQAFVTALVCLLFVVLFDTAGVQFGLGQQAELLDESGRLPGAREAYLASAFGTAVGAMLGTSPVIIHNETAAGIQEGGRTGLCALTTAVLFLASPTLVPLIELVPHEATAPCLVLVGAMMMAPVRSIDFGDLRVALPAFLVITVTPLSYSISAGISAGIASHVVLQLVLLLADSGEAAGRSITESLRGCTP